MACGRSRSFQGWAAARQPPANRGSIACWRRNIIVQRGLLTVKTRPRRLLGRALVLASFTLLAGLGTYALAAGTAEAAQTPAPGPTVEDVRQPALVPVVGP